MKHVKKGQQQGSLKVKNTRETKEVNEGIFVEDEPFVAQEDILVVEVKEQCVGEADITAQSVVENVENGVEGENIADSDVVEDDVNVEIDTKGGLAYRRLLRLVLALLIISIVFVVLCYAFQVEIHLLDKWSSVFTGIRK